MDDGAGKAKISCSPSPPRLTPVRTSPYPAASGIRPKLWKRLAFAAALKTLRRALSRDMERLEKARARLDRALERLEAAQQALDDRVRVLKAAVSPGKDWQELIRAVEAVQKENHTLLEREERLRDRLDRAIAKLSAMLGDGAPAAETGSRSSSVGTRA